MASLGASRSLCGHVPSQHRAACSRPFIAGGSEHERRSWWAVDLRFIPSLPHSGCPDRLQASQEPSRLDLPGHRSLLDAHLSRGLHPWHRTLPRDDRRADPGDMDTPRGAARHLPYPALPRRQATFEEVASAGLALWGGDGVGQLGNHLRPRTSGRTSWGTQPLRAGGNPPWVFTAGITILLLLPLCMLASALSLVLRYRRSRGEEREQIKWIAFAASVVGLLYLITMVSSLTYSGPWGAAGTPVWLGLLQQAALVSFTAVPIAVGFAVLKYRLYDIDVIINRTL